MRDSNGKTIRGKRAGAVRRRDDLATLLLAQEDRKSRDVHSRIDGLPASHHAGHAHNLKGSSATAAICGAAKYYECSLDEETAETHCIPRLSQTRKQFLGAFPAKIETEPIKTRQWDFSLKRLVETSDNRLVSKSDTTLLRRGNPFKDAESGNKSGYKREGSVSVGLNTQRYREGIVNARTDETILGPLAEDVYFPPE